MQNSNVLICQVRHSKKINEAEVGGEPSVLESSENVLSREEKDYQQLVSEKLKASADWDIRDSKMFSIG